METLKASYNRMKITWIRILDQDLRQILDGPEKKERDDGERGRGKAVTGNINLGPRRNDRL
jgi:hypothetical protein